MALCDGSKREIQLMASINDNHIVRYYTSWQSDNQIFMCMELCVGSLRKIIG
jgi:serine/threonine protein kinase